MVYTTLFQALQRVLSAKPKDREVIPSIDYYITNCPNDQTGLVAITGVMSMISTRNQTYIQHASCPDCGYQVYRKPSEKDIAEHEAMMNLPDEYEERELYD